MESAGWVEGKVVIEDLWRYSADGGWVEGRWECSGEVLDVVGVSQLLDGWRWSE